MQRTGLRPKIGGVETDVPLGTFNSGELLRYNGTTGQIDTTPGGGGGSVSGPGSSTVGDVVTWNNTSGTQQADGGVPIVLIVSNYSALSVVGNIPRFTNSGGNDIEDSGIAAAALRPNLTANTTWYVNGSTGNDSTGTGAIGAPWLTFARAWTERNKYGDINATLRIICQGALTYTIGALGRSVCGNGGSLSIEGDSFTTNLSGTFSGPAVAAAGTLTISIPSATALGAVDAHKTRFLRITSGTFAGAEFQIGENTGSVLTLLNVGAFINGSFPAGNVTAGDSYIIFTPSTGLSAVTISDWSGGAATPPDLTVSPLHYLRLCFIAANFTLSNSVIALSAVSSNAFALWSGCQIKAGLLANGSRFGVSSNSNWLGGAGYRQGLGSNEIDAGTLFLGVSGYVSATSAVNVGSLAPATFLSSGLRCSGTFAVVSGNFGINSLLVSTYSRFDKTTTVEALGSMQQTGTMQMAVSSGDALIVRGLARLTGTRASGGTTAGAGFGSKVNGPGRIAWAGLPTLTGGTAGADIKTDNTAAIANATLAAAGNALLDAINGGVVARV